MYNPDVMKRLTLTQTPPLVQEEDGTVRIAGSRITIDTIVDAFQEGATAEQIQDSFPSLSLRQIYGTIAYYLEHQAEVEEYLQERRAEAEEIKREIEARQDITGFRDRIRARRAQLVKP